MFKKHRQIADLLKNSDDVTGIAINWRFFGNNAQIAYDDRCVMERFTRASWIHDSINEGVKTIHKTNDAAFTMLHYSLYNKEKILFLRMVKMLTMPGRFQ